MSNSMTKAEIEFDLLDDDAIVQEFREPILALVDAFGESGQSGGSAPFVSQIISSTVKKLCMQEPIGEITGSDSEWLFLDYSDDPKYQNKRLSSVFKDSSGGAYYINAIVWQGEDEHDSFTGCVDGFSSSQNIRFPFKPKTFYIDVIKRDYIEGSDKDYYESDDGYRFVYQIKDLDDLRQVWNHYVERQNDN